MPGGGSAEISVSEFLLFGGVRYVFSRKPTTVGYNVTAF